MSKTVENRAFEPASIAAVRIAQPEDVEGIMALARLMHREVGLLPLDEGKVRAAVAAAVGLGLVGVTGHPEVHGCLCMEIGSPWYSAKRILFEFMFFVREDHRQAGSARSLIAWAKFMSDGVSLPLTVGVFGIHRTKAKIRLCERQLEPVGATFMHNRALAEAGAPDDGGA